MSILLTGGTGFVGSHTAVELINSGYDVIIADNLSNSSKDVLKRIEKITGKCPKFYEIDVAIKNDLLNVFDENKIDGVIHFAGFKCVPESTNIPLKYYRNNLDTTLTLLEVMEEKGCNSLVFSSSSTVYGSENPVPFNESMPTGNATNPYGTTKLMIETIIKDFCFATPTFSAILLRYFNPIGAHPSGLIGETPNGIPNNLMPYITQTAIGIRDHLNIFGTDYNTPDGTGVRDYVHVVDLARGHVDAIKYVINHKGIIEPINLGTGKGSSVLEIISAFEKANNISIPIEYKEKRPGDVAYSYASVEKAKKILNWSATYSLEDMCAHAWNWERNRNRNKN